MSAGEHIDNLGAALAKVRQPQVAHHEEAGSSQERDAEYRENDAAGDAIELAIMRSPAQTIGNVLVHATIAAAWTRYMAEFDVGSEETESRHRLIAIALVSDLAILEAAADTTLAALGLESFYDVREGKIDPPAA